MVIGAGTLANPAIGATFNLQGLFDSPTASLGLTADDGTMATVTGADNAGGGIVHVSFNLGLGSVCDPNPPGPGQPSCSTEMNGGDVLTFSMADPFELSSISFTNFATGDFATVLAGGNVFDLSGPGDIVSGTLDTFSLGLSNITSFDVSSSNSFGGAISVALRPLPSLEATAGLVRVILSTQPILPIQPRRRLFHCLQETLCSFRPWAPWCCLVAGANRLDHFDKSHFVGRHGSRFGRNHID